MPIDALKRLLSDRLRGRAEQAHFGCVKTGDGGYGKESVLELVSKFDLGLVFVMPNYIL